MGKIGKIGKNGDSVLSRPPESGENRRPSSAHQKPDLEKSRYQKASKKDIAGQNLGALFSVGKKILWESLSRFENIQKKSELQQEIDHLEFLYHRIPEAIRINKDSIALTNWFQKLTRQKNIINNTGLAESNLLEISTDIYGLKTELWKATVQMLKYGIDNTFQPLEGKEKYWSILRTILETDYKTSIISEMILKELPDDQKKTICTIAYALLDDTVDPLKLDLQTAVEAIDCMFKFAMLSNAIDLAIKADEKYKAVNGQRFVVLCAYGEDGTCKTPQSENSNVNIDPAVFSGLSDGEKKVVLKKYGQQRAIEKKKTALDKIETFLFLTHDAKQNIGDVKLYIRILEKLDIFTPDEIAATAETTNIKINADDIRNDKNGWLNSLARQSARVLAENVETDIRNIINSAIIWDMEIGRRISERAGKCVSCGDVTPELQKEWTDEIAANIYNEGLKRFEAAEKFWGDKIPAYLYSIRQIPHLLRLVKTSDDWLDIKQKINLIILNRYSTPETIAQTMRAMWLAGNPNNPNDDGYIKWLRRTVDQDLPSGVGKISPFASNVANVVFADADLEIPNDAEGILNFNNKILKNVGAVYEFQKGDSAVNTVCLIELGTIGAMMGIALGVRISLQIRGAFMEAGWGVASELTFGQAATIWSTSLIGESFGFVVGSDLITLPATGIPKPIDFLKEWGSATLIFAGIHGIGRVWQQVFGFTEKAGAEILEAGEEIAKAGRRLRAVQASIGYHGSGMGLIHEGVNFASLVGYLHLSQYPLSWIGLESPVIEKGLKDHTERLVQSALSLFVIVMGSRSSNIRARNIERIWADNSIKGMADVVKSMENAKIMKPYALALSLRDDLKLDTEGRGIFRRLSKMTEYLESLLQILKAHEQIVDTRAFFSSTPGGNDLIETRMSSGKHPIETVYDARKAFDMSLTDLSRRYQSSKGLESDTALFVCLLNSASEFYLDSIDRLGGRLSPKGILTIPNKSVKDFETAAGKFNATYGGLVRLNRLNGNNTFRLEWVKEGNGNKGPAFLGGIVFEADPDDAPISGEKPGTSGILSLLPTIH